MKHAEFEGFFREVTAVLGLSAEGYRRTGGSVRKRLARRLRELGLGSLAAYRRHLDAHPDEWAWIDRSCRITISRFGRDAAVYAALVNQHLPAIAAAARALGQSHLRVWSAGAASGEEPYGVAIAWRVELQPLFPELVLDVLATDADATVLARAARGAYPEGSLRELPVQFRAAFDEQGDEWWLRDEFRAGVRFEQADLRREHPPGPFDLISCRNLAFTYFDEPTQRRVAAAFADRLRPHGVLVVGRGERTPSGDVGLLPCGPGFYARAGAPLPMAAEGSTRVER